MDNGNILTTDPLATIPDRLKIEGVYPVNYIQLISKIISEQYWDPSDPDYLTGSYGSRGISFNDTIPLTISTGSYLSYIGFAFNNVWLKSEYVTNDKNYVITHIDSDQMVGIFGNEISNIESSLLSDDHYFIYQENEVSIAMNNFATGIEKSPYQGFYFNVLTLRLKDNYVPVVGDTIKFHFKSEFLGIDSDFSYTF